MKSVALGWIGVEMKRARKGEVIDGNETYLSPFSYCPRSLYPFASTCLKVIREKNWGFVARTEKKKRRNLIELLDQTSVLKGKLCHERRSGCGACRTMAGKEGMELVE